MTDSGRDKTVSFYDPGCECRGRLVAADGGSLPMETPSEPILSDLDPVPDSALGHYQLYGCWAEAGRL
jgi:hypothetical protein